MTDPTSVAPGWSPGASQKHLPVGTTATDHTNVIRINFTRKFESYSHHLADTLARHQAYGRAIRLEQLRQNGQWPDPADFRLGYKAVTSATAIWL